YILGGDSLPAKKPDPMPLLHVCDKLGFSIAQSYMIGDSKNDILAGQNAGMDTLGYRMAITMGRIFVTIIRLIPLMTLPR
ncbi:HAD-IA family hydrolase, partial [Escherichia coli]|uniref:HAD-IA family hydrolase n=1 Tax=Escherichia coli TaxID=562 RepID=UPI0021576D21